MFLYPLLALMAFPTLETLIRGSAGWAYAHDVFDDGGGLPRLAIAVRDWAALGPTLWDPYLTAGNAFLGQFALPPIAPDTAVAFLVGPFWAWAISVWVTASLAGIGMHLFMRDSVGLSTPAVVGASVMTVFCFWHPIYGVSIAILPLVLWLGDRATAGATRSRRVALAWVVVAAMTLYAGQLQVAVFVAAIQIAWLLTRTTGRRWSSFVTWFVTWALAVGLYAPVLITQLVMLPISQRTVWDLDYLWPGGIGGAFSTVIHHYTSVLLGIPLSGWGPGDPRYGILFLGGIGLPLVIAGLVTGRRDRLGIFLVALLVAIPVIDFVAMAGKHIQENVGLLRSFQFVRIRHFFPFALAAVAGLGIHALLPGGPRLPKRRRVIVAVASIALVPVAIQAAIASRRAITHVRGFAGSPDDVGWILISVAILTGLVGGVAMLLWLARRPGAPVRTIVLGIGLLFVADRAALEHGSPLLGNSVGTFDSALGLTQGQAFLLRQPGIAGERVLTFGDHANRMAFHGLRQVDGYQAIYPVAYHGFFGALTGPALDADPARWRYFHQWGARAYAFGLAVDPELVSLAGGRWLYVAADRVPTVPGLIERFRDEAVVVYENPAAFRPAFLVGAVAIEPDQPAVLERLRRATLDDLAGMVVATGADAAALSDAVGGIGSPDLSGKPGRAGTALITVDTADRIEIDVWPERGAILVLTDTVAPGWVALVDGVRTNVHTVDATFRGVALAPTARQVVFRYEPSFTYVGFVVAALASAAAVVWITWVGRRRTGLGDADAEPDQAGDALRT